MIDDIRKIALEIVTDIIDNDKLSHIAIKNALDNNASLSKQDRSFITRLSNGTVENLIYIDYVINQFSKTPVNKMKVMIRNVVRIGVYQIVFMDSVTDYAACNEAVKLIKESNLKGLSGFVNGLLRNISRNKGNILLPDKEKEKIEYYSILYSIPQWIIKKWIKDYGEEIALKLVKGSIETKEEISLRINTSKTSKEDVLKLLEEDGVKVKNSPYYENGLLISNIDKITSLKAFQKGYIQPQDASSMLVGLVAKPKKGDIVFDVCAAPGGKSMHIADLGGIVTSFDVNEKKVSLIKDNIERSGFENIRAKVGDALKFNEELVEKADIVIADLPCSGLGVLSKKTDIKYKTKSEDIKSLTIIQRDILRNVSKYVRPGGVLIYSTCTVNKNENDKNVKFLVEELGFKLEKIDDYIPECLKSEATKEGYLQLFQGIHECDGFFIARLKK